MCNEQTFDCKSRVRRDASRRHDELCIGAMVCGFFIAAFVLGCEESALIEQSMKIEENSQAINGSSDDGQFEDITDFYDPINVEHRRAMCRVINQEDSGYSAGSGISISPYHVLTAAHIGGTPNSIIFGLNDGSDYVKCDNDGKINNGERWEKGSQCNNSGGGDEDTIIRRHSDWEDDSGKDIAVIRMRHSLDRYPDIGYYGEENWAAPDNDHNAHLFGYGSQDCPRGGDGSGSSPDNLRWGWYFNIEQENGEIVIMDGYQPARDHETWGCDGDSGGPYFDSSSTAEPRPLIAIHNGRPPSGNYNRAVSIDAHRNWILDIIQEDNETYDQDGDGYYDYDDVCPMLNSLNQENI